MAREIILGKKGHRRRKLGPLGRQLRAIGIFMAVVIFVSWAVGWMYTKRRVRQAQLDISRVAHAARLFRADFGRCPQNVEELVTPPEGAPYLLDMSDPWGKPYSIDCPSRFNDEDVDVYSNGPDGTTSGADNIQNLIVELEQ